MIASKAIMVATTPARGIFVPTSRPNTRVAPKKPNKTPTHCLIETFSFNNGPARALVKTGLSVTINAAMPVGRPFDMEKKTPPK